MGKVLIASDDSALEEEVTSVLEAEGHEIVSVVTGQEVLEVVLDEPVDLVFLTANLPVFNGYDTCQMLRDDPEVPRQLPVILMGSPHVDIRQVERVGLTDVLEKNHTAQDIRDIVVEHMPPLAMP